MLSKNSQHNNFLEALVSVIQQLLTSTLSVSNLDLDHPVPRDDMQVTLG